MGLAGAPEEGPLAVADPEMNQAVVQGVGWAVGHHSVYGVMSIERAKQIKQVTVHCSYHIKCASL